MDKSLCCSLSKPGIWALNTWAGIWDSGSQKNIHRAMGMLDMPLFMGGQATHVASCASSEKSLLP